MHRLSEYSPEATAYIVDVGQHQMWAGQSLHLSANQRFLTSGGMGAMGSALPLAIGAAFALKKPVVAIAGDGGFQINIQELQTVAHHKLPVKIIIINNQAYGMVRQFQQSYFNERYQSTVWGVSAPDFTAVAKAYHIPAHSIKNPAEIKSALAKLWHDPLGPYLLNVSIDLKANAYPKIAFGYPFTEMEPFLTEKSEQQT
jgi:acetolactate synthase-1/2/3 large subunit